MKSRFASIVEYIVARFFLLLFLIIPSFLHRCFGKGIGFLLYLIPSFRKVIYKNIDFTGFEVDSKKRFAREVCKNFGITLIEFLTFPRMNKERLFRRVRIYNINNLKRAYNKGRGVVVITCHMGNWEYMASAVARSGFKVNAIVRPLDNKLLDKYASHLRVNVGGYNIIPRGLALRDGIRAIKRGEILAFLMDQNSAFHGVFTPFLGKLAATVKGPAIFSAKYNVPVVPAYCFRRKDGRLNVVFLPELNTIHGSNDDVIVKNTRLFNEVLTRIIKKHPTQWLWFHPRFRTRPEGEKEFY